MFVYVLTLSPVVVLDQDHVKNMGVENVSYVVGSVMEHYEKLQRYDMKEDFIVRL